MKNFKLIFFLIILGLSHSQARTTYQCGAQCLGLDLNRATFFQVGHLLGTSFESKSDALKDLSLRCERRLAFLRGAGSPTLVKLFSLWETSSYVSGFYHRESVYRDYYMQTWSQAESLWVTSTYAKNFMVEFADEKDCDSFEQTGSPDYIGDLPVNG